MDDPMKLVRLRNGTEETTAFVASMVLVQCAGHRVRDVTLRTGDAYTAPAEKAEVE